MTRIYATIAALALCIVTPAHSQTPVETSSETRLQLDLQVPDAALKSFLPEGFTSNPAAQGPAKDCNLRLVFIDRITINGPDGKPLGKGSNRLVYLAAPVKDPSGASVQLVIGGLTEDPSEAPGPFGNYLLATTHDMRRTTTSTTAPGPIIDTQDWTFAAKSGEHLELHIKYERGTGNLGKPTDAKFYSAKNPTFYQTLPPGASPRHPPQHHHQPTRPRKRVHPQNLRRQLRQALRQHRKSPLLGQHPLDQPHHLDPLALNRIPLRIRIPSLRLKRNKHRRPGLLRRQMNHQRPILPNPVITPKPTSDPLTGFPWFI